MPVAIPPVWSDPTSTSVDVAAGGVWTQAAVDAICSDLAFLGGSSGKFSQPLATARMFNGANISIPNGALTAVTFNTVVFDTDNMTGSFTSRITSQHAGKYAIGACIEWAPNATGSRVVDLVVTPYGGSATIVARVYGQNNGGTYAVGQTVSALYTLNGGDYVEVQVFQDSGGALLCNTGASYAPVLWAARVGG